MAPRYCRRDLFFNFSAPFEIHDDHEILMRMNLHKCDPSELPQLVPPEVCVRCRRSCQALNPPRVITLLW